MKFTLAPTKFDRWPELHKLLVDAFAYMAPLVDPPSSMDQLTPEDLRSKSETEILLIVCDEGELVACAYFNIRPNVVYLSKIAVRKTHRQRGITKNIFAMADDVAHTNNRGFLELETRIELEGNHKIFAALGFIKTDEYSHPGYDRTTSITLRRGV